MNSLWNWLGHMTATVVTYAQALLRMMDKIPVIDPLWRILVLTVVGTFFYLLWHRKRANRLAAAGSILNYLFPLSLYRHQSSKIDYFSIPVRIGFDLLLGIALPTVTLLSVEAWLLHFFGEAPFSMPDVWPIVILKFFVFFVVAEFFLYINHYLFHKIPFLWRLHRAHHSAEVLTPLTYYRFNPVEILTSTVFSGMGAGMVTGCIFYVSGMQSSTAEVATFGTITFLMYTILEPFYHSHIWVSFGRTLNGVFLSPCMHQIHHSALLKHRDKNLGGRIALWDYLFGTLYVPERQEEFPFGISAEEIGANNPHKNIRAWMVEPLKSCIGMIIGVSWRRAPSNMRRRESRLGDAPSRK